MATPRLHPAQQFAAPANIQRGTPLKELIGRDLAALIGRSLAQVVPGFNNRRFLRQALQGLDRLELTPRAIHLAQAMAEQLPEDFNDAAPLLIQSFGPPLTATERNGLAVFYYWPHAQYVAEFGVAHFAAGMQVNYELTQRSTAEFSIRPFLVQHRAACLQLLRRWTKDDSPHVRRLVSEGTRPRLPWALRLKEFQQNPQFTLPLLERLKDDPSLYVRRSVANHLGDIAKDHPQAAYEVCAAWLEEISRDNAELAANRRWTIRHALRLPAKRGDPQAVRLRALAVRGKR